MSILAHDGSDIRVFVFFNIPIDANTVVCRSGPMHRNKIDMAGCGEKVLSHLTHVGICIGIIRSADFRQNQSVIVMLRF